MAFRTNKMPVLQEKSASGAVATFNTALAMPLVSCNIAVNAWQEGSGDPSPSNVRPIHGFDKANVIRSGKTYQHEGSKIVIEATQEGSGDPSPSNVRPIHAGLTIVRDDDSVLEVYGGTLDVVSGELVVTKKIVDLSTVTGWLYNATYDRFQTNYAITDYNAYQATTNLAIFDNLKTTNTGTAPCAFIDNTNRSFILHTGYTEVDDFLENIINGHYAVVTMMSQTIQLSATELQRTKVALGIDTYTIQLGQEVYGGVLDSVSGKLVNDFRYIHITSVSNVLNSHDAVVSVASYPASGYLIADNPFLCNEFKPSNYSVQADNHIHFTNTTNFHILTSDEIGNTVEDWETWLLAHPCYVAYKLATPIETDIGATPISTNIGNNTIFADTGDIDLTYKDLDIAKRGNFREVFRLPS